MRGRKQIILALGPGQRIQGAPHAQSARGVAVAAFIAVDAADDIRVMAGKDLVRQIRIGDKRPAHDHHIRIAAGQNAFSDDFIDDASGPP